MTSNRHRVSRFTSALPSSRPTRTERIARQLREEIASLMVRDMKDPRVRMASVSTVDMSPDLRNARVMISSFGDEPERRAVVTAMRHAEGYLRAELGHRLENLKYVPHLSFELDESIAYSVRISSMLNGLEPPADSTDTGKPT